MRVLIISPAADRDLDQIWEFIAADSIDAADRVASEFRAEFDKLATDPGLGHYRPEIRNRSYRVWALYSYLIIYRADRSSLHIIRVIHGARDIRGMF